MMSQDRIKVGRIQSWMDEDGSLKLYGHQVGVPGGVSCSLSAEEALGLLDLLSRHREVMDKEAAEAYVDYTGGWISTGQH